jgi:DNA-binding NarL/FixJ family response regulator
MFLVRFPLGHPVQWLFVHSDPRLEGCTHPVQPNVEFNDDAAKRIKAGEAIEAVAVARSTTNPRAYRRFIVDENSPPTGFEPLNGTALELSSWASFAAWQVALPPEQQDPEVEAAWLSEREAEVLKLIALGYSNKEIAGRMGVSVKTVETYKRRSLEKMDMRSRVDIVRFAIKQGWLNTD